MFTVRCANGHVNSVGQRFCGECGGELVDPRVEASSSSTVATLAPAKEPKAEMLRRRRLLVGTVAVLVVAVVIGLVATHGTGSGSHESASNASSAVDTCTGDVDVAVKTLTE